MPTFLLNPTVLLAIALAIATAAVHHYRSEYLVIEQQFEGFKQVVDAKGKQAEAEAKLKESQYANQITVAVTSRDAALVSLRNAQARANSGKRILSNIPTTAGSPDKICFSRAKFESAFGTFNTSLQEIARTGDTAIIDDRAWMDSWPKPPSTQDRQTPKPVP